MFQKLRSYNFIDLYYIWIGHTKFINLLYLLIYSIIELDLCIRVDILFYV